MEYVHLLKEIMREGKTISPRGQEVKEIMHVKLDVGQRCLYDFAARPLEKVWAYTQKELAWYLSGDRNSSAIVQHAKMWGEIQNPDKTVNSNYGYLVFYRRGIHPSMGTRQVKVHPGFEWAARSLEKDSNSRQAIITYNSGGYCFDGVLDFICSQHQAFFIRENRLLCYIALRSSDAIFGLAHNMPWWQLVYQMLHLRLLNTYPNLQAQHITVDIYSAHVYERHYELVRNMIRSKPKRLKFIVSECPPLHKSQQWYEQNLNKFVKVRK